MMAKNEVQVALNYREKILDKRWKELDILEKEEMMNFWETNPIGKLNEINDDEYQEYIDWVIEFRLNGKEETIK